MFHAEAISNGITIRRYDLDKDFKEIPADIKLVRYEMMISGINGK